MTGDSAHDPHPPLTGWRRSWRLLRLFWHVCSRSLRWTILCIVGLYFLFGVLVLGLRYLILPQVSAWKPEAEQAVSRAVGRQVSIGALDASWHGLHPRLELTDVRIADQQGQTALSLPRIDATLSWWSIPFLTPRFDAIELLGPALQIRRDTQGRLLIAGFIIDPSAKSDGKELDWVLSQHCIVIRDGSLIWQDTLHDTPPLRLQNLVLDLRNQWNRHQFALRAEPSGALAAPIDIRGNLKHKPFAGSLTDMSTWSGELYADLRQTSLVRLQHYLPLDLQVREGYGAVRAWLTIDDGRMADLTADVRLARVQGRFGPRLPELDMQEIKGRIRVGEKQIFAKKYLPSLFGKAGHQIELTGFSMTAPDGSILPPTSIREDYTPGADGQPEHVQLYAESLDLGTIAGFASHLPIPEDQRQMLADFEPRGQLKRFSASWSGRYPDISRYQLKGEFNRLGMRPQPARAPRIASREFPAVAAVPAIPGFTNLSGFIDASEKGGSFSLNSTELSFNTSGYFVDPALGFDRLQMAANWRFVADAMQFQIARMELQQGAMRLQLSGKHQLSLKEGAGPGQIELTGRLHGFDISSIDKFIPTITPPDLRHWLTHSLLGGTLDDTSLRLKGNLQDFPFAANDPQASRQGEFVVKGRLKQAKLDFSAGELAEGKPLWPLIEQINGQIIFDRAKMDILADTARTQGVDLKKVRAVIPDLIHHQAELQIDGQANGQLQQMLGYVAASPVRGWLSHFLDDTKASAASGLHLKLNIPLNHVVDTKVNGQLQFMNNEVSLQPGIPVVSGVSGKLEFTETGVSLGPLRGQALGGAIAISGGSQKDGSIRVRLDGSASAEGLRDYLPTAQRHLLDGRISGSSRYTAALQVRKQAMELNIESTLQGMALQLPAPLNKPATDTLPLRIDLVPQTADAGMQRDELRIVAGNLLQARYLRQRKNDGDQVWQVIRGGIGIQAAAPEPVSGVDMKLRVASLNIDEWQRLLPSGSSSHAGPSNDADLNVARYFTLRQMDLKTSQLQWMGKQLQSVNLQLKQQGNDWLADLQSEQITGQLKWSPGMQPADNGQISAHFSHLRIPSSVGSESLSETVSKLDEQLPGLEIVAENFELKDKKLGRLELNARNQRSGKTDEWILNRVTLKNPDAELKASGKWRNRGGGDSQTELQYELNVQNSGKLLERLGFEHVLTGGKGSLRGELRWNGLPYALDFPSMSGKVALEMNAGQFLKVDPGAAKLLGVLSMQSLPRRLTLDFRDVFSEGFAFDAIQGDALLQHGVARTDNLRMRGVSASVLMAGSADLQHETQDLHVAVIPVINAGAASVVYGLAVNPVIGLGTFLAQLFLKDPLAKAFTFEYGVSGSWREPNVRKLERNESSDSANTPKTVRN